MTTMSTSEDVLYELGKASFGVGGRVLLHPLSLTLARRRVYGLLGHNGSGKSTLVKLLARQQAPTGGTIRLGGVSLPDWGNRALARKVAYLPQQLPAADGMTVKELVALGRYPWHGAFGRFTPADAEKVEEALRLTDTARFSDNMVDTLSGGERQRAWIAMLVAQNADCLLLDEPISALDVAHQLEVMSLVRKLSLERGIGVVVVLHDINIAARFCDSLIALKQGRVAAHGAPAELMHGETLTRIFGVPMGTLPHPGFKGNISFAL